MNVLARLFGKRGEPPAHEEAVIVHLDAQGLPDEVYEEHDLATLEDQLIEAIEAAQAGEFDGNEFGPGVVTLYMYGANAEHLFSAIEAALRAYPLCAGARVLIRRGGPGAPERELVLGV